MSDLLLEWMSFRMSGRVSDLPTELAGDRPRRIIENLVTLAHAELDGADAWRIAPPVLAGGPYDSPSSFAVLCGARTPGVLARLTLSAAQCDSSVVIGQLPGIPSLVKVTAPSAPILASVARNAGIGFQPNAGFALLACTPAIRHWPRKACEMVRGRVGEVRRFSRSRLAWVTSSLEIAQSARSGFFRIQRDYDWVSIFKTGVANCAYIDDRAGRMAASAKLGALGWDSTTCVLTLPSQLYPPSLIARGLALCTGSLPQFNQTSRQISFGGVTPAIFRMAQAITGLRAA